MELQYKGANCIQITTKSGQLITDPLLSAVGLKDPSFNKIDVCLLTESRFRPSNTGDAFVIDCPGEYEIKNFAIQGDSSRTHMSSEDKIELSTIYRVTTNDITVAIFGHIYPELTDDQLEWLGMVDIMCVPVGGNGYTLDATGAAKLVRQVSPKIIIPTHYEDPAITYEVPQSDIDLFVKELGLPHSVEEKLKIKGDLLSEGTSIIQLQRS